MFISANIWYIILANARASISLSEHFCEYGACRCVCMRMSMCVHERVFACTCITLARLCEQQQQHFRLLPNACAQVVTLLHCCAAVTPALKHCLTIPQYQWHFPSIQPILWEKKVYTHTHTYTHTYTYTYTHTYTHQHLHTQNTERKNSNVKLYLRKSYFETSNDVFPLCYFYKEDMLVVN